MKYPEQPTFSEDQLTKNPLDLFAIWLETAKNNPAIDDYNAMCLSTIRSDGSPDSRMVLLKEVTNEGFVFYTNYTSSKGKQILENPSVCLNFFWDPLHRQIRIRGKASQVTNEQADAYFQTRHRKSQIGAWASLQSQPLDRRETFENRIKEFEERYPNKVPRPDFWSGFLVTPQEIEFWQHRDNRLHDRFLYRLENEWKVERLYP